ncbi:MAG: hypothetical protein JNG84_11985 [Archangium sp.]|nr:hypothetical protein [Archangium sp.]
MPARVAQPKIPTSTKPATAAKPSTGPSSTNLTQSIDTAKKSLKSLGWLAKSFKKEGVKMGETAKQQGTKALETLEKKGVKFANRNADTFEAPKKR